MESVYAGVQHNITTLVIGHDVRSVAAIRSAGASLDIEPPVVLPDPRESYQLLRSSSYTLVFVQETHATDLLAVLADAPGSPKVVVTGRSRGRRAFEYAALGADAFLDAPLETEEVVGCLADLLHGPSLIERMAASRVGRIGLKDVQQLVRRSMFRAALEVSHGSRHASARLLGIDRRAVQLMAKDYTGSLPPVAGGTHGPSEPISSQVARRVNWCAKGIILWQEFPVQTEESVTEVFGRIRNLAYEDRAPRLLIDLREAAYPTASVKDQLRQGFRESTELAQIAVVTGGNEALAFAARTVLGPLSDRPLFVRGSLDAALAAVQPLSE